VKNFRVVAAALSLFVSISAAAQVRVGRSGIPQRPSTGAAHPQTAAPAPLTTAQTAVPSITLSGTNHPQVAQYTVFVPADGQVWADFGPTTGYGLSTARYAAPAGGGSMSFYVAGMRAFTAYHLRLNIAYADGSSFQDVDRTFTTGGLTPDRLPAVIVHRSSGTAAAVVVPAVARNGVVYRTPTRYPLPSGITGTGPYAPAPGIELIDGVLPSTNQIEVFAVDLRGNIVWYYDFPKSIGIANPIKLLPNGDFMILIGPVPATPSPNAINSLREIDLAGNTVHEFTLADLQTAINNAGYSYTVSNMHHDFLVLPNGNLVVIVNRGKTVNGRSLLGDGIVELDQNFNVVWLWDAFDHLDTSRFPYPFVPSFDWTHANALVYLPASGDLLLSSRHQSWVMKIDFQNGAGTGNVLWRLGNGGDFTITSGNPADWAYGQHNPGLISQNGSQLLLNVFDDGNFRTDSTGAQCNGGSIPCYSRNVIYSLDESTMKASVVYQYRPGVFSMAVGSSQLLSNGHMEADFSFITTAPFSAKVVETTNSANPLPVWELDLVGEDAYRTTRLPSLYPGVTWNSQ
jgi:arylsulfate sulfotransferase